MLYHPVFLKNSKSVPLISLTRPQPERDLKLLKTNRAVNELKTFSTKPNLVSRYVILLHFIEWLKNLFLCL